MKPEEKKIAQTAIQRAEKFKTIGDIQQRISTLEAELKALPKGKRGRSAMTRERAALSEKLYAMQEPGFDFGRYEADQFQLPPPQLIW